MPPFRAASGKFSPGVNLSIGDLISETLQVEGHWLSPKWKGTPWRVPSARVLEVSHFWPPEARPTVRALLFAYHYGQKATGRLRATCGKPSCLKPQHQEETVALSKEICEIFFREAFEKASQGEPLELSLPFEGRAISYRHQLNAWRKKSLEEGFIPREWNDLVLRLRPLDPEKPKGAFVLWAEIDEADSEILGALERALGRNPQEDSQPSARDLVLEDIEIFNSRKENLSDIEND